MTSVHGTTTASYLKVGTPLSALIPAPERTTILLAAANTSLKAFMSLEGPSLPCNPVSKLRKSAILHVKSMYGEFPTLSDCLTSYIIPLSLKIGSKHSHDLCTHIVHDETEYSSQPAQHGRNKCEDDLL